MASKRNVYPGATRAKELPSKTPTKVPARGKVATPVAEKTTYRPSEATAIGGLTIGETKKKDVVDLTKEEAASSKMTADSREVTFNKLQGKTFPSLVVVARPTLRAKENNINDRPALDAKVKSVLMHSATKYTEWLIQQGLVRSEQTCQIHSKVNLKLGTSVSCVISHIYLHTKKKSQQPQNDLLEMLNNDCYTILIGMYSDASKFPYSGGYVWISDCCPSRFISVFSGSLFEGMWHNRRKFRIATV